MNEVSFLSLSMNLSMRSTRTHTHTHAYIIIKVMNVYYLCDFSMHLIQRQFTHGSNQDIPFTIYNNMHK